MEAELGPLSTLIGNGDVEMILNWLRNKIHVYDRVFSAGDLCRRVTGESLDPGYFIEYLNGKYAGIYGFRALLTR